MIDDVIEARVGSASPGVARQELRQARTTALASFVGNTIEWYDFYVYGIAAGLVLGPLFFPSVDPLVGTLLSFATYALGAFIRPLGGAICGHYGDRVGRKKLLVFTLVGMGSVTFLIGLLPDYNHIGIWAAILLITLRMCQGIAFGGEWAGAILMVVERAPPARRGLFGSVPQMGSPVALFLSNGIFALLAYMPKDDFLSWGWRIPFLLSAILVVVGLVFRLRLLESPEFVAALESKKIVRRPVVDVVRHHWRPLLIACGIILGNVVAFQVQVLFVVSYATQNVGMPRQIVLNAVLVASGVELLLLPFFAVIADRVGLRAMAIFGSIVTALTAFPFFWLVNLATPLGVTAGISLAMIGVSAIYSILPAYIARLFETHLRYSGIAISYNVTSGLIGGVSPLLAVGLLAWANSYWPVALYLIVIASLSVVAAALGPRDR